MKTYNKQESIISIISIDDKDRYFRHYEGLNKIEAEPEINTIREITVDDIKLTITNPDLLSSCDRDNISYIKWIPGKGYFMVRAVKENDDKYYVSDAEWLEANLRIR